MAVHHGDLSNGSTDVDEAQHQEIERDFTPRRRAANFLSMQCDFTRGDHRLAFFFTDDWDFIFPSIDRRPSKIIVACLSSFRSSRKVRLRPLTMAFRPAASRRWN